MMAGGSLGMTISIPDQVVLVGGTGRHLSDRFSFTPDVYDPAEQEGRFTVRLPGGSSPQKSVRARLGPSARRGYNDNDEYEDEQENLYGTRERPHVLKRLGMPLTSSSYGRWGNNYSNSYGTAHTPGQVGRHRPGYQNSGYRGGGSPFHRFGGYNSYRGYYNHASQYYGYSRPRFNYNSYYTSPYSFRGYNYRGRYNNYQQRFSRARRGRGGRNAARETLTKDDLDRDLDEFRQSGNPKKENGGDVNMG